MGCASSQSLGPDESDAKRKQQQSEQQQQRVSAQGAKYAAPATREEEDDPIKAQNESASGCMPGTAGSLEPRCTPSTQGSRKDDADAAAVVHATLGRVSVPGNTMHRASWAHLCAVIYRCAGSLHAHSE